MSKKPAVLPDSLFSLRPRKGEARPQTETQAAAPVKALEQGDQPEIAATSNTGPATARRRKRRSEKTQQLNLRVSEETLERFTKLADQRNLLFGDLLVLLLDDFSNK